MNSLTFEILDDNMYNITLEGTFKISQSFILSKSELETLKEIRNHLDEDNYKYKSNDGVINYESGVLTFYFEVNNENDRLNTNIIHIENVREFIDKLLV